MKYRAVGLEIAELGYYLLSSGILEEWMMAILERAHAFDHDYTL